MSLLSFAFLLESFDLKKLLFSARISRLMVERIDRYLSQVFGSFDLCASKRSLFLFCCSSLILGVFIQGAGGLVNLVLFKGACLSIHSRISLFKVSS